MGSRNTEQSAQIVASQVEHSFKDKPFTYYIYIYIYIYICNIVTYDICNLIYIYIYIYIYKEMIKT